MTAILLRFGPYLAIVILAGAWYADHTHAQTAYAKLEADFGTYRALMAAENARISQEALRKLNDQITRNQKIENERYAQNAEVSRLSAALRDKYARLRVPACEQHPSAHAVPEASGAGRDPESAPRPKFLGASGSGFIDIAERAERVRLDLIACQTWAKSLQGE